MAKQKKKRRMLEKRKVNEQKSIGHPKGLLAYKDPSFSKQAVRGEIDDV